MSARWVPVSRLEALRGRIERLGHRAERLGQDPPRLRDTGERRRGAEGELAVVELVGKPPRLSGWEPLAEIHHGDDENAVHALAPGLSVERWAGAEPACDHCGVRRRRATTYVLRHESGRLAQVGTSCLADFTGTADPLSRIGAQSPYRAARAELEGAGEREDSGPIYVPLVDLLAHVVAIAEEAGFVGRAQAQQEGRHATYELALERVREGRGTPEWARERAAEVERWVLDELRRSARKDAFERRLVASFELGERVHPDRAALVASAYPAWLRARGPDDDYLGEPGERVEVAVEVVDVRKTERGSRWGDVFWHRLRDGEGRELAWFAVGTRLEPDSRVRLSGTVRRHDRFAGRALTVLERCRVAGGHPA